MRWSSSYFSTLILSLWASLAHAQEVALARTPGDQRIANRISAELSALGFNVHIVAETQSAELLSLRQIATERGAIVGLRASPSKTGIELWIANPNTGATAFEEVVTVDSGRNDELLALRAVEVLRARLLKLGVRSTTVEDEPMPRATPQDTLSNPKPPQPPVSEQPWLTAELGISYTHDPSALSDHVSARLGLSLSPDPRWSLGVFSMIPIREAKLENEFGSVSANSTLFGATAAARFKENWFGAHVGAGAALVLFDVEGYADFPYEGQQQRLLAGLPFLTAGASAELAERVFIVAEVLGGFTAPRTTIRINDEEAATWGRPLIIATLSLQLAVLTLKR